MAFLSPKERADVYLLESVNLCLERRTKKLVSQYFTRAVIQSVFLSSTCLHKSKHEKLGERANSFEYYISGRQMGGFFCMLVLAQILILFKGKSPLRL